MQVYFPDKVYKVVKERLPASELLQDAVRAEMHRQELLGETDRYVEELVDEIGEPSPRAAVRADRLAAGIVKRADPAGHSSLDLSGGRAHLTWEFAIGAVKRGAPSPIAPEQSTGAAARGVDQQTDIRSGRCDDGRMTSIGSAAQRPNPALEPLTPLVGRWRTSGTHPLVPGTTFHGHTSFEWHEGGAFLLMRSEIDEPEVPSGVAIIGSDDSAGTFTMIYFDEREVSRRYTVEVAGGVVSWHRDEAGFAQRMVLTVADGTRIDARGTMSHDGGSWEDDLQLTYERVDS